MGIKLDIGCGNGKVSPEHIGVDINPKANPDKLMDVLRFPWPWDDNSVSEIYASHFIEHVPAVDVDGKDLLVRFCEEMYRVLEPGGLLLLRWPSPTAEPAFQDPTHRRFISRNFLAYLNAAWRKEMVSHCDWNMDFQILRDKVMMDERIAKHKDGSRFAHYHFNAIVAIEAELQVVKPMRT